MKRILFLLLILTIILGLNTCKRAKVDDPQVTGPAGFHIILSGTADPSTLYLPLNFTDDITSTITVVALNNDGSPAINKKIIFQAGAYGYFEGVVWSDTRTTDGSGMAQIEFILAPGCCTYAGDTQVEVKAIYVDDSRLDLHPGSHVADVIPLRIVPEGVKEMILIRGRVRDAETLQGIAGVPINFTAAAGVCGSGMVFSGSPSGHFYIYVPWNWTGTVSAGPLKDYTFTPASYTFDVPLITDQFGVNFLGQYNVSPTLVADVTSISAAVEGTSISGAITVTVSNSTTSDVINCNVGSGATWVQVNPASGSTQFSFQVTIDDWTGNSATDPRTADITITATSPSGVTGSPFTITVTQSNI